ncbi:MAG: hypothetical protein OEV91_02820 [Desulfobulbaceae bacterium]|nr:hypothetical protein [Desulfobulbaceae bacterium]
MNRSILRCAALLSILLLTSSCGRKTTPVPPQTVLPAPISDLRHQLDEHGVTLVWSAPTRTVQGAKLAAIDGFELLRAVVAADEYCEGCPIPFGTPIEISGEGVAPGASVQYTEAVLRPGYRYFYKVRTKLGWYHAGGPSNTVSFAWNTLILAPVDVKAAAGDRTISISWLPPATLIDGSPITSPLRYRIFRSESGADFVRIGQEVTSSSFKDDAVRNDKRYFYKVQALTAEAVGMLSKEAVAVARDMTPPAPPQHVTAVKTGKGVKILWQAASESDLAGYRIYRRANTASKPRLLGEAKGGTQSFIDTTPLTGATTWYYSVTAFDQSEPANESTASGEADLVVGQ